MLDAAEEALPDERAAGPTAGQEILANGHLDVWAKLGEDLER
jgi:hypothetical protein